MYLTEDSMSMEVQHLVDQYLDEMGDKQLADGGVHSNISLSDGKQNSGSNFIFTPTVWSLNKT